MSDPGADVEDDQVHVPHARRGGGLKQFVRNSPWVVISVGVHVVVFAALGLFYVTKDKAGEDIPPLVVQISNPEELTLPDIEEPPPPPDRKVVPDNVEREVSTEENNIDDPTDDTTGDPTALNDDASADFSGGTAMGVGTEGSFGGGRPSPYTGTGKGRKGSRAGGATQATEKAVLDGMRWLLRHQNKDGSWTTHGFVDQCQPNSKCQEVSEHSDDRFDEGLTGLAVLAFLGAGYTPESKQYIYELNDRSKKYRIGESVKRALQWLVKRQKKDGSFTESGPFMYNEAICTLAITEAFGRTPNRAWKNPAIKAIEFLAAAQRPSPSDPAKLWGWRYDSRAGIEAKQAEYPSPEAYARELHDADTSVTGWVAMAFKSAVMADIPVPETSVGGAVDFSNWIATDSGLSGYQRPEEAGQAVAGQFDNYTYHAASMAAVNACIRAFLTHNPNDEYFVKAADVIIKDLPKSGTGDELNVDYYYWYYATLALNQVDGPEAPKKTGRHWNTWNNAMTKAMLGLQDLDEKSCSHGGWIVADRWAHEATPIYSTAINVLTLEVYYRYPNAFGGSATSTAPKPR